MPVHKHIYTELYIYLYIYIATPYIICIKSSYTHRHIHIIYTHTHTHIYFLACFHYFLMMSLLLLLKWKCFKCTVLHSCWNCALHLSLRLSWNKFCLCQKIRFCHVQNLCRQGTTRLITAKLSMFLLCCCSKHLDIYLWSYYKRYVDWKWVCTGCCKWQH